jgi:hypothetical protein
MFEKLEKARYERAVSKVSVPIGLIYFLFVAVMFASPLFWVWGTFELACKVALTGFVGALFFCGFWHIVKKIADGIIKERFPNG